MAFLASDSGSNHHKSGELDVYGEPLPVLHLEIGQILVFVVDLIPTGYVTIARILV